MSLGLKNKIEYFRQHWFVRNVAVLQIGSFGGTFVQALFGILIARFLQPELFGVYSLAIGLASLTGLLLGAGMQDAVATIASSSYGRGDREEFKNALAFLLKITFYAGLATLGFFIFVPSIAGHFYGNSSIGWYAGIVMLGVFFSSSLNATVQLSLQVVGRIKMLALLIFSDQFLRSGLSLLFVFLGLGVVGGVSGQLAGAVIISVFSFFVWNNLIKHYDVLPALRDLIGRATQVSVKKYLGFTFWVAVDRNLGNVYMALPVVLTGIYVSSEEVAFFKLAFGFVNLALSLLGPVSVLLNMEFPKMQIDGGDRLNRNFVKVSLYGMALSTVLTLGVIVVSPLAFRILYGESFMPSVQYVFGLVLYGALFGIGIGLGPMWRAINKVKVSIIINLFILGVGIPLGLFLIRGFGIWGSVIMVTLWFSVSHLASFVYLIKNLKLEARNPKFETNPENPKSQS